MPRNSEVGIGATKNYIGGDYTAEEEEFIRAMNAYKVRTGRMFPQFTEVLAVAKSLGYRKVREPEPCEGT